MSRDETRYQHGYKLLSQVNQQQYPHPFGGRKLVSSSKNRVNVDVDKMAHNSSATTTCTTNNLDGISDDNDEIGTNNEALCPSSVVTNLSMSTFHGEEDVDNNMPSIHNGSVSNANSLPNTNDQRTLPSGHQSTGDAKDNQRDGAKSWKIYSNSSREGKNFYRVVRMKNEGGYGEILEKEGNTAIQQITEIEKKSENNSGKKQNNHYVIRNGGLKLISQNSPKNKKRIPVSNTTSHDQTVSQIDQCKRDASHQRQKEQGQANDSNDSDKPQTQPVTQTRIDEIKTTPNHTVGPQPRRHKRSSLRLIDHLEMKESSDRCRPQQPSRPQREGTAPTFSPLCNQESAAQGASNDHASAVTLKTETDLCHITRIEKRTLSTNRKLLARDSKASLSRLSFADKSQNCVHHNTLLWNQSRVQKLNVSAYDIRKKGSAFDESSQEGYRADDDLSVVNTPLSNNSVCRCNFRSENESETGKISQQWEDEYEEQDQGYPLHNVQPQNVPISKHLKDPRESENGLTVCHLQSGLKQTDRSELDICDPHDCSDKPDSIDFQMQECEKCHSIFSLKDEIKPLRINKHGYIAAGEQDNEAGVSANQRQSLGPLIVNNEGRLESITPLSSKTLHMKQLEPVLDSSHGFTKPAHEELPNQSDVIHCTTGKHQNTKHDVETALAYASCSCNCGHCSSNRVASDALTPNSTCLGDRSINSNQFCPTLHSNWSNSDNGPNQKSCEKRNIQPHKNIMDKTFLEKTEVFNNVNTNTLGAKKSDNANNKDTFINPVRLDISQKSTRCPKFSRKMISDYYSANKDMQPIEDDMLNRPRTEKAGSNALQSMTSSQPNEDKSEQRLQTGCSAYSTLCTPRDTYTSDNHYCQKTISNHCRHNNLDHASSISISEISSSHPQNRYIFPNANHSSETTTDIDSKMRQAGINNNRKTEENILSDIFTNVVERQDNGNNDNIWPTGGDNTMPYTTVDKNGSRKSESTDQFYEMIRQIKRRSEDLQSKQATVEADTNASNISINSRMETAFLADYMVGLWENQWLCDVQVSVGGKQFLAHKLILAAFSDVFCPNTPNPPPSVCFDIPDSTPEAVMEIFRYMYTGSMDLTDSLIEPVLCAALYMGVAEVVCLLEDIMKCATANNILLYLVIARNYNISFKFATSPAIQHELAELLKTDFFSNITKEEMHIILDNPDVEVESEQVTLQAVLQWMEAHEDSYDPDIEMQEFLKKITLESIPPKSLSVIMEQYGDYFALPGTQEIMLGIFQFHATKKGPFEAMNELAESIHPGLSGQGVKRNTLLRNGFTEDCGCETMDKFAGEPTTRSNGATKEFGRRSTRRQSGTTNDCDGIMNSPTFFNTALERCKFKNPSLSEFADKYASASMVSTLDRPVGCSGGTRGSWNSFMPGNAMVNNCNSSSQNDAQNLDNYTSELNVTTERLSNGKGSAIYRDSVNNNGQSSTTRDISGVQTKSKIFKGSRHYNALRDKNATAGKLQGPQEATSNRSRNTGSNNGKLQTAQKRNCTYENGCHQMEPGVLTLSNSRHGGTRVRFSDDNTNSQSSPPRQYRKQRVSRDNMSRGGGGGGGGGYNGDDVNYRSHNNNNNVFQSSSKTSHTEKHTIHHNDDDMFCTIHHNYNPEQDDRSFCNDDNNDYHPNKTLRKTRLNELNGKKTTSSLLLNNNLQTANPFTYHSDPSSSSSLRHNRMLSNAEIKEFDPIQQSIYSDSDREEEEDGEDRRNIPIRNAIIVQDEKQDADLTFEIDEAGCPINSFATETSFSFITVDGNEEHQFSADTPTTVSESLDSPLVWALRSPPPHSRGFSSNQASFGDRDSSSVGSITLNQLPRRRSRQAERYRLNSPRISRSLSVLGHDDSFSAFKQYYSP